MSEGIQPNLGQPGQPCEQCGSPLAADQRYCLNCGARRGGPRVDYRQRMQGAAASTPAATPEPSQPDDAEPAQATKGERDFAPLAAVGGIAVLGLMLLVGVLIGRGDSDGTAAAPAPIVVRGGGEAEPDASGGNEGAGDSSLGTSGGGAKSKGKQAKNGGETAAEAGAVTASKDDLAELEGETGEEAAKNALKLPDKIATPGAPPPIDKSKPPGGGEGGGLVIK